MKIEKTNDFIKFTLPESVASANAESVSNEIFSALDENSASNVIIDLSNTEYISSAGLRVLLKIQKSKYNLKIINASLEVYEIFEMTGFTNIMNIEKQRRKISLDNAVLIGNGFNADVYRITDDTIVKVFVRNQTLDDIKRELNLAKQAFILGVPTAISYDIVEVDDKYGVVFELIDSGLLRDAILNEPENFDDYMKRYAELLSTMNKTDIGNTSLPNIKDIYLDRIQLLKSKISEEDYNSIIAFVKSIPDSHTFVHGDCHIKNIMYSGSELLLIDMDTLSYGNPIFELAQIYSPYLLFEKVYENNVEEFFEIPFELAQRVANSVLDYYFKDFTPNEKSKIINKISKLAHIYFLLFILLYKSDDTVAFDKTYDLYKNLEKNENENSNYLFH